MQLCVIVPVPDYRVAAASRATDALWPAVLAHQGEAFRVIEQGCEVDRVRCGHDDRNPSCSPATADRLEPSSYPNPPPRASITPEADKSLLILSRTTKPPGEPRCIPCSQTSAPGFSQRLVCYWVAAPPKPFFNRISTGRLRVSRPPTSSMSAPPTCLAGRGKSCWSAVPEIP